MTTNAENEQPEPMKMVTRMKVMLMIRMKRLQMMQMVRMPMLVAGSKESS